MRRLFRIILGIPICFIPLIIGSIAWIFDDSIQYKNVLLLTWYVLSGDWSKIETIGTF